ncbi:MAG: acyloxyacyl hydrolase [Gammaproteobacteria bacterium]|nr:acyloxyacyl hydrolase [Gammaproteobacteria bacterium]
MYFLSTFLLCLFAFFSTSAFAIPIGFSYSKAYGNEDPPHLHGYRVAVLYQPKRLVWPKSRVYIDMSFSHWWLNNVPNRGSVSIYAIAPVFRHYFFKSFISPFLNISIGVSWMTRTRLYPEHNMGMHFAFQDQVGGGIAIGRQQQFSLILSALHYSNASLSAYNGGITAPVMLSAEYQFE